MMYNWHLMAHIYVMWAKLMFSKVALGKFSLMEQLFLKKIFSRTCTLRGKKMMYNWPLLTHIDVMWAKLMFLKYFSASFH